MPSVDERRNNSIKKTMEVDLRLQGDKIKLESRPESGEASTASAKSAYLLQGPLRSARPVSAVPMLTFYKDTKDDFQLTEQKIKRRPYSADNGIGSRYERNFLKLFNTTRLDRLRTNSYSSLHNIEEIDKDSLSSLPSTELLKTLVDEPINSWPRRVGNTDQVEDEFRKRSARSDFSCCAVLSLCDSSRNKVHSPDIVIEGVESRDNMRNSRPPSEHEEEDEQEPTPSTSKLTPGLKSKPPLPPSNPTNASTQGPKQPESKHNPQFAHGQPDRADLTIEEQIEQGERAASASEAKTNLHFKEIKEIQEQLKDMPSTSHECNSTTNANSDASTSDDSTNSKSKLNVCDSELLLQRDQLRDDDLEWNGYYTSFTKNYDQAGPSAGNGSSIDFLPVAGCSRDNASFTSTTVLTGNEKLTHDRARLREFFEQQPKPQKVTKQVTLERVYDLQGVPIIRNKRSRLTQTAPMNHPGPMQPQNLLKINIPLFNNNKNNNRIETFKEDTESWMSRARFTPVSSMACPNSLASTSRGGSILKPSRAEAHLPNGPNSHEPSFEPFGYLALGNQRKSKSDTALPKLREIQQSAAEFSNVLEELWDSDGVSDDIEALLDELDDENQRSQNQIASIKKFVSHELSASINSIPAEAEREIISEVKVAPTETSDDTQVKLRSKFTIYCPDNMSAPEPKANTDLKDILRKELEVQQKELEKSKNYKQLLNYLDEVEKSNVEVISRAKERIDLSKQLIASSIKFESVPKLEDLVNFSVVELANEVIDLDLRLKNKVSSITILQDELSNLRDIALKSQKTNEKIVQAKLREQKSESDAVITRHQKFIDQLMADKKALNEQCEGLLHEMKCRDEKCTNNMKAMEHKHAVEVRRIKEVHIAGEKMRRERWIDEKTRKIKDLTVKSIEPELQAITVRHERELSDLRALHKREIEDIEINNARKTQNQLESMRQRLSEDKEQALAHERDILRKRYEEMVSSEENNCQEQRKRLLTEHANRLAECEAREAAAIAERDRCIDEITEKWMHEKDAMNAKHVRDMDLLRENANLELEKWKIDLKKQHQYVLNARENALKEEFKKERDKSIECVLDKMDAEMSKHKAQLEFACDERIRKIKEKYESDLKALEATEIHYKDKYNKQKMKFVKIEEEGENLRKNIEHLEGQLSHTSKLYQELLVEKKDLREKIKEEMRCEMMQLQDEVEKSKREKDEELQKIYGRVKVTVARKDEIIAELTRDQAALQEKCTYLENMMNQQRREYLTK